jgi:hypothetical protein
MHFKPILLLRKEKGNKLQLLNCTVFWVVTLWNLKKATKLCNQKGVLFIVIAMRNSDPVQLPLKSFGHWRTKYLHTSSAVQSEIKSEPSVTRRIRDWNLMFLVSLPVIGLEETVTHLTGHEATLKYLFQFYTILIQRLWYL